jgi:hypothetical protein
LGFHVEEQALEAARKGWLGQVYLIRGVISNQLDAARRPEWAEFKGGNMFELGGHVLDPYVGSGTTLVACERTGRSGTGVEVNARHWVTACKRLRAAE